MVVWNRDRSKAEVISQEVGATIALSAAEAAATSDFVLSSLADDEAVKEVYLAANGVVEGIGEQTIALDTSTVDPATILRVGEAVDGMEVRMSDLAGGQESGGRRELAHR